jgi:polar amino acid transport system substrate-binding protein
MKRTVLVVAFIAVSIAAIGAQSIKVAVPQLSPLSTDAYKALAAALLEATGATADIQILPFARCVYSIENKDVDLVSTIVSLPDQKKWAALKYDYSTTEVVKIVFVLFAGKGKKIDVAELKKGNPKGFKLETDAAHTGHFPFAIAPSSNVDASLKKVDLGEIDGYIFSQSTGDAALKRLGLKNVRRINYDTFTGKFLLQKGGRGGALDKRITEGMAKIKANGKYSSIMDTLVAGASTYIEWQP